MLVQVRFSMTGNQFLNTNYAINGNFAVANALGGSAAHPGCTANAPPANGFWTPPDGYIWGSGNPEKAANTMYCAAIPVTQTQRWEAATFQLHQNWPGVSFSQAFYLGGVDSTLRLVVRPGDEDGRSALIAVPKHIVAGNGLISMSVLAPATKGGVRLSGNAITVTPFAGMDSVAAVASQINAYAPAAALVTMSYSGSGDDRVTVGAGNLVSGKPVGGPLAYSRAGTAGGFSATNGYASPATAMMWSKTLPGQIGLPLSVTQGQTIFHCVEGNGKWNTKAFTGPMMSFYLANPDGKWPNLTDVSMTIPSSAQHYNPPTMIQAPSYP